ncbi:MAG: CDP-diacylglycerol--glycerol-3-phosphate 3-phosphatidyltransferase [Tissierellia bacterium]|nr:CDP-diacylglycerol--glycerol-3-phosphate 3-phosphatidyltransferase [Tissierellia bacterium]
MNIANKLTLFRILLVPVFVILRRVGGPNMELASAFVFIIAAATDFLDGNLARKYNLVTTFGKFADPLADKILTVSAFILCAEEGLIPGWGVIIIVAREFIVTGLRVLAASEGITIAASFYGKLKTTFQLISIIALLFYPLWGTLPGRILFYVAVALTLISGWDYLAKNKAVLNLSDL